MKQSDYSVSFRQQNSRLPYLISQSTFYWFNKLFDCHVTRLWMILYIVIHENRFVRFNCHDYVVVNKYILRKAEYVLWNLSLDLDAVWNCERQRAYHSHFRKVEQSVVSEIGCAFLDERQISEVHAQIRNARRVAPVKGVTQIAESSVRWNDTLQLINRLSRLEEKQNPF